VIFNNNIASLAYLDSTIVSESLLVSNNASMSLGLQNPTYTVLTSVSNQSNTNSHIANNDLETHDTKTPANKVKGKGGRRPGSKNKPKSDQDLNKHVPSLKNHQRQSHIKQKLPLLYLRVQFYNQMEQFSINKCQILMSARFYEKFCRRLVYNFRLSLI
jgi:hypothetical protein